VLVRVTLKPGRDWSARAGHPWIFSGAIAATDGTPAGGEVVEVRGADGRFVGRGTWNDKTSIAVRLLTRADEPVDAAFVAARVSSAVRLRELIPGTDAVRLVNGEGDFFPGLVVDRYGEFLIAQFLTAGAERLKPDVVAALQAAAPARGIYERSEGSVRSAEGLESSSGVLAGEQPPDELTISESGRRYLVDLRGGQKTGFYLDQRPNRDRVAAMARDRRVLNLFAYTGGFSIAAGVGGAERVISVDSSAPALVVAERAWALNGLPPERATFVRQDVFGFLRRGGKLAEGDAVVADLIVLDPPPFARRRADHDRALTGYKEINLQALRAAASGALVMTFSCSQHVSDDDFAAAVGAAAADARRDCQILERLGPGLDHPQSLAHPEGRYLKGLLLRVA
jgi:23S rRNA (cytosine1962-C5)-methyltransferase